MSPQGETHLQGDLVADAAGGGSAHFALLEWPLQ